MNTFKLEIITPERIVYTDEVEMVVAPSADGIIGVLAHHVPLFSRLIEGEVKIVKRNEEVFLAIGSGYLEVSKDKVILLVSSAFKADELDEKEILEAKRRAEEALEANPEGDQLYEAQALFRRSTVALKLIERRRRSRITH
jgi:F-type H+-transporting ATPase subunit epsilon